MQRPRLLILGLILMVSLPLAACGPAAAPTVASPAPATAPVADAPSTLGSIATPPTSPPEAAPTETIFVGPGGQYATDPATVNLAAGRPTMVKFFAFW